MEDLRLCWRKITECTSDPIHVIASFLQRLEELVVMCMNDVNQLKRDGDRTMAIEDLSTVFRVTGVDFSQEPLCVFIAGGKRNWVQTRPERTRQNIEEYRKWSWIVTPRAKIRSRCMWIHLLKHTYITESIQRFDITFLTGHQLSQGLLEAAKREVRHFFTSTHVSLYILYIILVKLMVIVY